MISFRKLTKITDEMAKNLCSNEGALYLDGLTDLSDIVAELLSKSDFELSLDGLTELSDAAAESLGKHQGAWFSLNGLAVLSDTAAERLSEVKGRLYLDEEFLTALSDAAAQSLSKRDADNLFINLDNLPESAAQILRDAGHGLAYLLQLPQYRPTFERGLRPC